MNQKKTHEEREYFFLLPRVSLPDSSETGYPDPINRFTFESTCQVFYIRIPHVPKGEHTSNSLILSVVNSYVCNDLSRLLCNASH